MPPTATPSAEYAQLEARLQQKERELYSIQRIGRALSSTLELDALLRLIIQEITTLMDADRSSLFLVDHVRGEIWSKIALKAEVREIRLPIGKGISGYVAQTGEVINIPDAYQDDRFDPGTDRKTGYRTRSILCMPVWDPHERGDARQVIGVIQVLNKSNGHFTGADEELLEALAGQVAISISNASLYARLDRKFRETDLLYEVEQMLSTVFDMRPLLTGLMSRTARHLEAEWVLGFLPLGDTFLFVAANGDRDDFYAENGAVAREWYDLMAAPTFEALTACWDDVRHYFRLPADLGPGDGPLTWTGFPVDGDNNGVVMALGAGGGRTRADADDRTMLELVGQKMARAQELHNLRETLFRGERLSAIGQMMSTIVHDIRGPVNTIYGFVDLMSDDGTTPEERAEFAGIIRDEVKSTMNMITEVLDFAKGKTSILPRKSSVRNILKVFKPRLEQMSQKFGSTLDLSVESEALVYADEDKLNRVFYNISKNAHEAMGSGGTFRVRVYEQDSQVVFQFTDTGPGIPREILPRLFESFVTSGKDSGTGLGLAIVKKIVDEHDGRIELESPEGEGATFRIHLPVLQKG